MLLDWRPNRTRLLCCGTVVLPEWWYRLHARQRKARVFFSACFIQCTCHHHY